MAAHVLATSGLLLSMLACACSSSPSTGGETGDASGAGDGAGPADSGAPFGSFGDGSAPDAFIVWCDAGPPRPVLSSTCELVVDVPCGLPPGVTPGPQGILSPLGCAKICPSDAGPIWESCNVDPGDGSGEPGVEVDCVLDCT